MIRMARAYRSVLAALRSAEPGLAFEDQGRLMALIDDLRFHNAPAGQPVGSFRANCPANATRAGILELTAPVGGMWIIEAAHSLDVTLSWFVRVQTATLITANLAAGLVVDWHRADPCRATAESGTGGVVAAGLQLPGQASFWRPAAPVFVPGGAKFSLAGNDVNTAQTWSILWMEPL